jgi:hypothetical protein
LLSPLAAVAQVVGWLVPQAMEWQLLVPELGPGATSEPAARRHGGGVDALFGAGRGSADRPRDERRRVADWLFPQDYAAMARRFTVRGAEELGRKAQGVNFETMFEEEGFAYELYPPKQVQRRNLMA